MLGVTTALLFLANHNRAIPATHDRILFHEVLSHVEDGWTQDQVKTLLGVPDDVWGKSDPSTFVPVDEEIWCYGTNGHLTFPTLGRVRFKDGHVIGARIEDGTPPDLKVISDAELAAHLRTLNPWPFQPRMMSTDVLSLVRCANDLRRLGKEKALAVILEDERLNELKQDHRDLLLLRVLFTPKGKDSAFPWQPPVFQISASPSKLGTWPTFPILLKQDIPFEDGLPYSWYSLSNLFRTYVAENSKNWNIRKKALTPPSDPFLAYDALVKDDLWKDPDFRPTSNQKDQVDKFVRRAFLAQVLVMVRNAYAVPGADRGIPQVGFGANDSENFHKAFLAVHPRWDAKSQMYVRGDNSFTPDVSAVFKREAYAFTDVPRLKINVSLERQSAEQVSVSSTCVESGGEDLTLAKLTCVDVEDGKPIASIMVNGQSSSRPFAGRPVQPAEPENLKHAPINGVFGAGSGFSGAAGVKVKLVLEFQGKKYESPVFAP